MRIIATTTTTDTKTQMGCEHKGQNNNTTLAGFVFDFVCARRGITDGLARKATPLYEYNILISLVQICNFLAVSLP